MLRGLALVNIYADDLDAARRWYVELLGIDAYFDWPGEAGFVTASVIDPFGNVLRVMYNPHYVDVLGEA